MITNIQSTAWKHLVSMLDRLPHALLLQGAPGVGKLALAERFAQLLVCEERKQGTESCGRCEGCRWYLSGNHPDIRYLEPETLARKVPVAEEGDEPKAKDAKPSN